MEKVEQTIRTSNQDMLVTLVLIRTDMVAPILHILESRVTRTGGMIGQIVAGDFFIDGQADAKALLTLVNHVDNFSFQRLVIRHLIGVEGWAALAEALRLLPPLALLHDILHLHDPLRLHEAGASGFRSFVVSPQWTSPRNLMLKGRRQDLQSEIHISKTHTVWCLSHKRQLHPILTRSKPLHFDVIGSRWDLFYPDPNHVVYYVLKEAGEDWARLELYLDTEDMK